MRRQRCLAAILKAFAASCAGQRSATIASYSPAGTASGNKRALITSGYGAAQLAAREGELEPNNASKNACGESQCCDTFWSDAQDAVSRMPQRFRIRYHATRPDIRSS